MSDKHTSDDGNEATDEAANGEVARVAPASKLALAAAVISVLAMLVRCEGHQQREKDKGLNLLVDRTSVVATVLDDWLTLKTMSASLTAKAQRAQPSALTAADCDHTDYARFVAARNSLATQLDAAATALGPVRYMEINGQLMALAVSTAEARELFSEACANAPHQLQR